MRLRLLFASLLFTAIAQAATPLEEAVSLYKEKRYPEAREALEKIVAAEPSNAAACYQLGMTLLRRGDGKASEDALPWLEKAAQLEPKNATYLADYGGISMLVAGKTRSITAATRGRDAMEKSLTIEPNNLEARVGLWRFYDEAPWPLGSSAKAAVQLEAIQKLDFKRAVMLVIDSKVREKHFAEAFKLCDDLLAKTPEDFFALFQYARVALASGQNLERGLDYLKKYVALAASAPPKTANPALAWVRIGNFQEKLGHPADARSAYQAALQIEPGNKLASSALENLP